MIKIGIFGGTGYTGYELIRILQRHEQAEIGFVTSQSYCGQDLDEIYPQAPALTLIDGAKAPLDSVDVVFLCLPHAAAASTAVRALHAGARVIDLSADFRLQERAAYEQWYGPHPAPELLETAVYGLTELFRDQLPDAALVANPGCYPTSILLPLLPLLQAGLTPVGPIIADAKSGTSGAGRKPSATTHFIAVHNNFSPYKIGRAHRHLPEMEQFLQQTHPQAQLLFSPHLLPVERGILSTIYFTPDTAWELDQICNIFTKQYATEPFIDLLDGGNLATLAHVTHTNHCAISITRAGSTLLITSAIDNLVKGAAGQAIQNMNAMYGLPETMGLDH